jgi:hypothetical protein
MAILEQGGKTAIFVIVTVNLGHLLGVKGQHIDT